MAPSLVSSSSRLIICTRFLLGQVFAHLGFYQHNIMQTLLVACWLPHIKGLKVKSKVEAWCGAEQGDVLYVPPLWFVHEEVQPRSLAQHVPRVTTRALAH